MQLKKRKEGPLLLFGTFRQRVTSTRASSTIRKRGISRTDPKKKEKGEGKEFDHFSFFARREEEK